jgi:hypothetical protein
MVEMRNGCNFLFGKPEGIESTCRDLNIDGRIILKCILNKQVVIVSTDFQQAQDKVQVSR